MKSIWNGSISFGMVNIPVRMYSAINPSSPVKFHLLHSEDHAPIRYKRWCEEHDKEVPWEEVVKGVEIDGGSYYIFTKEELEDLRPEKSDVIEIEEFISPSEIDDIYIDKHYFLGPEKPKQKPYFLFRRVLLSSDMAAVGKFVMREREYLCSIEPYGGGLLLNTLNFAHEVRNVEDIGELGEEPNMKKEELDLARQLIEKLTSKELDIQRYKDDYAELLRKAIEGKEKAVQVELEPRETAEENLIAALRKSLET